MSNFAHITTFEREKTVGRLGSSRTEGRFEDSKCNITKLNLLRAEHTYAASGAFIKRV